jgi:hypothetical protein
MLTACVRATPPPPPPAPPPHPKQPWFQRDTPLGMDLMLENFLDPAHVPWSHHVRKGLFLPTLPGARSGRGGGEPTPPPAPPPTPPPPPPPTPATPKGRHRLPRAGRAHDDGAGRGPRHRLCQRLQRGRDQRLPVLQHRLPAALSRAVRLGAGMEGSGDWGGIGRGERVTGRGEEGRGEERRARARRAAQAEAPAPPHCAPLNPPLTHPPRPQPPNPPATTSTRSQASPSSSTASPRPPAGAARSSPSSAPRPTPAACPTRPACPRWPTPRGAPTQGPALPCLALTAPPNPAGPRLCLKPAQRPRLPPPPAPPPPPPHTHTHTGRAPGAGHDLPQQPAFPRSDPAGHHRCGCPWGGGVFGVGGRPGGRPRRRTGSRPVAAAQASKPLASPAHARTPRAAPRADGDHAFVKQAVGAAGAPLGPAGRRALPREPPRDAAPPARSPPPASVLCPVTLTPTPFPAQERTFWERGSRDSWGKQYFMPSSADVGVISWRRW